MSFELVYTSAQRGLKPNSSGFCTVAATGGISRLASMKLEGLSAYEFHFKLSDANANLNPANFAHTVVKVGGKRQSVLSRVGFAGPDYSGRANKIAHHFLLGDQERLAAGPGEMLTQLASGKFCEQWQSQPGNLQPCSLAESLSNVQPSEPAGHWQSAAGDAGWAGMLAKAFKEGGRVPAYVLYAPGTDVLRLFAESLAVLPPQQRWEVNFATYYTSMPAGCYYNWRGILAGSRAAQEIAKFPNAVVIDLTKPLGQAPDNEYTNAARSGQALAAAAGVSAGLRNVEPDDDEIDDLDDIYKLAQEEEPTRPTKRRRKVAAPIDMLAAGAAQANATPSSRSNKGLKITIAVLSLLVAALLITVVLTLAFFKGPAITDESGELAKNTGGPPSSAPRPTTESQPATQLATNLATTQKDSANSEELAFWRDPIANALAESKIAKANELFDSLDKKAPDWVRHHQEIKSLRARLDKKKEKEKNRKEEFKQCMDKVAKAGEAKSDEKLLNRAEELAESPDEKSQVKKWRDKINAFRRKVIETKMEEFAKAKAKAKTKAQITACLTLITKIGRLPGIDDKSKEKLDKELARLREELDKLAKTKPTYGTLTLSESTAGTYVGFDGKPKSDIFGDKPSDKKEVKFRGTGSVKKIRFFRNKLGKAEERVKPRLLRKDNVVWLIISDPSIKPPKDNKIGLAEYYVTNSPGLSVRLLDAARKNQDLRDIAEAVVVEISGSRNNADIYKCRIRRKKEKVSLSLGFTEKGGIRIPKCSIEYPWISLLRLKLPGTGKPALLDLNKDAERNLPLSLRDSPILSWTLNKEKMKIDFSIKTKALENWQRISKEKWKQVKPLYDEWKAHEQSKGKVKKEQGKNWDEKKWKNKLDNKRNAFDRKAKLTLDPIFENIKKFAIACNNLDEIVIRDPWGVTLETFKVEFPMATEKIDRGFVMRLGRR